MTSTVTRGWRRRRILEAGLRRQISCAGCMPGAQLLAEVLGASVSKNAHEEIGWYPVQCTREPGSCAQGFTESFEALHWHGDTFSIPAGASHFISSEGCENQAFVYENHAIALQFHLEMLPSHVQAIYQACGDPGKSGPYIQGLEEMLADCERFRQAQKILKDFLMAFISRKMTLYYFMHRNGGKQWKKQQKDIRARSDIWSRADRRLWTSARNPTSASCAERCLHHLTDYGESPRIQRCP